MSEYLTIAWPYIESAFAVAGGIGALFGLYFAIKRALFSKLTWRRTLRAAEALLEGVEEDSWEPDLVMGLGRSGALWAGWLAGNLGSKPVFTIDRFFDEKDGVRVLSLPLSDVTLEIVRIKFGISPRILVVEGATSSGHGLSNFVSKVADVLPQADVRTASIFVNAGASYLPTYVGVRNLSPWPEEFPWHLRRSYRRHMRTRR
ncbi:MAG: hypothetical protein AAFN27_03095 [Pseudomonadota bacterium]